MTKKFSNLSELVLNIAEFFGVTEGKSKTGTFIERALRNHQKHGGKNIVLLTSNDVSDEQAQTHLDFSILEKGLLHDRAVLALGRDRSVTIYKDTVDCINRSAHLRGESLVSQAKFFQSSTHDSDQDTLSSVARYINNSVQPTFAAACLNSAFFTQNGKLTENASMIANLIEATKSTGTLYLLTRRHQQENNQSQTESNTVLRPIVPLFILAELLRHKKSLSRAVDYHEAIEKEKILEAQNSKFFSEQNHSRSR